MKKIFKKLIWVAIIALIIFAIFFNNNYGKGFLNLSGLQNFVDGLGIMGPIILILLLTFQGVISIFPATILFVLAGTSFGFTMGLIYCLVGALLGATIAFKIAKKYGKRIELYLLSKKDAKMLIQFTRDRKGYLTSFGRMLPIFPTDIVSFSAGIENMKFKKYILTSAIGFIVPITFFMFVGERLLQSSINILTGITVIVLLGMFFIEQNHSKILNYLVKK